MNRKDVFRCIRFLISILSVFLLLASCGGNGGSGDDDDDDSQYPEITLQVASIIVDGSPADWWGKVDTLINDVNGLGDNVSVPGSDVESVYLAVSQDGTTLYFLISTNNDISTDITYRIWFDNNTNGEIDGEPGDRQVDIFHFGIWQMEGQDMVEPQPNDINVNGTVVANGQYLEGSINMQLGISGQFYFSGRTQSSINYNRYNSFYCKDSENNPITLILP